VGLQANNISTMVVVVTRGLEHTSPNEPRPKLSLFGYLLLVLAPTDIQGAPSLSMILVITT
jgi:hypothetical protein